MAANNSSLADNSSLDNNASLADPSDIIKEATSLLAYKVAIGIEIYYGPVVWVVGVIGNILSFLVMMMKHNRAISCCVYMAFLAVTDLIYVAMSCQITVYRMIGMVPSTWGCRLTAWTMFATNFASILMVVAMTADRYLAICHPHNFQHIRTSTFATKLGAGLVVGILLYTIPYPYLSFATPVGCGSDGSSLFYQVFATFNMIVISVVPFLVLLTLNSRIAMVIRRRGKTGAMPSGQQTQSQIARKKLRGEKQLTFMLFLVCGAMLLLTLPLYTFFLLSALVNPLASPKTFADLQLLYHLATRLSHTNHAINFLLYVIVGKRFRKDLVALFTRGYGRQPPTTTTGGVSFTNTSHRT